MGTKQFDSATDLITFTRASGGTALRKVGYDTELVTNGTFDTDLTGWATSSADWTWDASARAHLNTTSNYQRISYDTGYATGGMQAGVSYLIEFDYELVSGRFKLSLNSTNSYATTVTTLGSGRFSLEIVRPADNRTDEIQIRNETATTELYIDNVSIKEVVFDVATDPLVLYNHPNNTPRIEYNADGTVKGLLIEEARTNEISTSEVAPTAYSSGITKAVDSSVVSPSGGNNVEKFTLSSANEQHYVGNHNHISASSGTSTYSIFAKGSGHNLIRLRMANTSGSFSCDFNLSTGQKQVTSVSDSSVTGAIESMGNGWWRCSMTYASEKTNPYASVFLINAMDAPLSNSFLGDGTSGVYVWGSQYEAGAFPTSYIPTVSSTATRAADFAQIPTSAFGYNNDKGSLVIDVLTPVADQLMGLVVFNTATYFNSRGLWKGNPALNASGDYFVFNTYDGTASIVGAVTKFTIDQQTQAEYTKLGLSYGDNENAVKDGGTVISGTSRYPNPTRLFLGGRDNGFQSQCWIKSIQYYPRQLTNTQLQELTT